MRIPEIDFQLEYPSYGAVSPRARVRLFYTPQGRVIAIVSELPNNPPSPSLTNSIEDCARALMRRYEIDPGLFDLIQHSPLDKSAASRLPGMYPASQDEHFETVSVPGGWLAFGRTARSIIGPSTHPVWSPVPRATVEQLVGGAFE